MSASKTRVVFSLTSRELDALIALQRVPASWPTFKRETWEGLHRKSLVTCWPSPNITQAGALAIALTLAVGALTLVPTSKASP